MYVGSTGFAGRFHYVVMVIELSLNHHATTVTVEVTNGEWQVQSDAQLPIKELGCGTIDPFEVIDGRDAVVLTALSSALEVDAVSDHYQWQLRYDHGQRMHKALAPTNNRPTLRLRFRPDPTIFQPEELSPHVIHSFLARFSHLNPDVTLSFTSQGQTARYRSRGMIDLFDQITQPYQILHAPIHIKATEEDLSVDLALAFHDRRQRQIWAFINKGRPSEGGTHADGLSAALDELPHLMGLKAQSGLLATMAVTYPSVTFEGATTRKVTNPELAPKIKSIVLAAAQHWMIQSQSDLRLLQLTDSVALFL